MVQMIYDTIIIVILISASELTINGQQGILYLEWPKGL
jgi:hypothetical protein